MSCTPISVALVVDPPSDDTEITFQLDKICNADGTEEWKLHFELDQIATGGTKTSIVKLDIDINHEDAPAAAATAKSGLDDAQRAQADVAAQTALAVKNGDATTDDAMQEAASVIPARTTTTSA